MTVAQAKEILRTYRPGIDDAQSPEVVAALDLCRQDVALGQWFEAYNAQEQALRKVFRSLPAPAGLAQQIISERPRSIPKPRWRRPAGLVTAGLLIVGAAVWWGKPLVPPADRSFEAYRARMLRTATRAYGMDLETGDAAQIRAFLAGKAAPADYELPAAMKQTLMVGCGVLRWQNQPVTMICFRTGNPLPAGMKTDLMLFVIQRSEFRATPGRRAPEFTAIGDLITASWQTGDKVYLLAGFDEAELKRRL